MGYSWHRYDRLIRCCYGHCPGALARCHQQANNQGILVDRKTFDVIKGNAKTDNPLATLTKMGAREVSAGAIVFRHGDKLYIVDGTPPANAAPQAMKDFQSNWNVSYMKNFQDNFATAFKCRNC